MVTIPGSLVVNGTNVETALNAGVTVLKATGNIQSSSTEESVEVGRSGVAAMVRIASTYATLRLEGVGQSQNFTGWSIQRNSISQSTNILFGTSSYMSWHNGANHFQQKVVLSQPLFFNTGPKIQRISGDSLEFFSGSNQAYKAMTLQGSNGHVITHVALHNYSDRS